MVIGQPLTKFSNKTVFMMKRIWFFFLPAEQQVPRPSQVKPGLGSPEQFHQSDSTVAILLSP